MAQSEDPKSAGGFIERSAILLESRFMMFQEPRGHSVEGTYFGRLLYCLSPEIGLHFVAEFHLG